MLSVTFSGGQSPQRNRLPSPQGVRNNQKALGSTPSFGQDNVQFGADNGKKKDLNSLFNTTGPIDENEFRRLLENGADPNKADKDGITPLFRAALVGRADIVQMLREYGADPDKKNTNGDTPLLVAASEGRADIIQMLLEK